MSKKNKNRKGDSVMTQNPQEDILTAMGDTSKQEDVVVSTKVESPSDSTENIQAQEQTKQAEPIATTVQTQEVKLTSGDASEPTTAVRTAQTPQVQTAPLQPKKLPPVVGQDINMLKRHLDDYIQKYSDHQVKNFTDKADVSLSITLFGNIINFILRYPEMELFEKVVAFFRKERSRILSPKVALRGIDGVNIQSQHRYSMFYSLMMDITSPEGLKQKNINMEVLEKMFNHAAFLRLLTNYLAKTA